MASGFSIEVKQRPQEHIFRVDFRQQPGEEIAWAEANLPEQGFIASWQTPFSLPELIPIIERCASLYEANHPDVASFLPTILYAHDGRKGIRQEQALQRPLDWDQIISVWESKEVWFVKFHLPMGAVAIQRQAENDLAKVGIWVEASDFDETCAAFAQLFTESKGDLIASNEASIFFNAVVSQFWRDLSRST